jgi:hypothetical protein
MRPETTTFFVDFFKKSDRLSKDQEFQGGMAWPKKLNEPTGRLCGPAEKIAAITPKAGAQGSRKIAKKASSRAKEAASQARKTFRPTSRPQWSIFELSSHPE